MPDKKTRDRENTYFILLGLMIGSSTNFVPQKDKKNQIFQRQVINEQTKLLLKKLQNGLHYRTQTIEVAVNA
jgi:uncharacterized membrane protein